MAREADIPALARERGSRDVAHGQAQRAGIAAGAHNRRHTEPGNVDAAHHRACGGFAATRGRGVGGAWGRRTAQNGVEFPGLEGLIERRFDGDVSVVAQADHGDREQQPLQPPPSAQPA